MWDKDKNTTQFREVLAASNKKYYWSCYKGHKFVRSVKDMCMSSNCSSCYLNTVEDNIAELMPVFVKKHWDYERNIVLPESVSIFDKKGVYYWKNNSDMIFRKSLYTLYQKDSSSSYNECTIFYFIKKVFPDAINRYKFKYNLSINEGFIEFDIFIPSISLAIEYDGVKWHKNSLERDRIKNEIAKQNSVYLLRIRETGLQFTNPEYGGEIDFNFEKGDDESVLLLNNINKKILLHIKELEINLSDFQYLLLNCDYKMDVLDEEKDKIHEAVFLENYSEKREVLLNYVKIHRHEILEDESILNKFLLLMNSTLCIPRTRYEGIDDISIVKRVLMIRRDAYFDFSLFDKNDTDRKWFEDYYLTILKENDAKTFIEYSFYYNLHLNDLLGDTVNVFDDSKYWNSDVAITTNINLSISILKIMIKLLKTTLQLFPNHYKGKHRYDKAIQFINEVIRNKKN